MKALPWILAGTALSLAIYVLVNNVDGLHPAYGGGNPDVDNAANKVSNFGTKQRVTGTGNSVVGKVKEGFGNITGDRETQAEGVGDQVVGQVKDTVGQAAHAVSDTIKDLNS